MKIHSPISLQHLTKSAIFWLQKVVIFTHGLLWRTQCIWSLYDKYWKWSFTTLLKVLSNSEPPHATWCTNLLPKCWEFHMFYSQCYCNTFVAQVAGSGSTGCSTGRRFDFFSFCVTSAFICTPHHIYNSHCAFSSTFWFQQVIKHISMNSLYNSFSQR